MLNELHVAKEKTEAAIKSWLLWGGLGEDAFRIAVYPNRTFKVYCDSANEAETARETLANEYALTSEVFEAFSGFGFSGKW